LVLVDGGLFQFFVLEVDNFKEAEHLRPKPSEVDAKLVNDSVFDVCEGVIGLYSDQNGITYGKVDRDGDLSLAHESHQLILDGHVAYGWRVIDSSQHLTEEVSEILFFLF
jgi:hypothetical protein